MKNNLLIEKETFAIRKENFPLFEFEKILKLQSEIDSKSFI